MSIWLDWAYGSILGFFVGYLTCYLIGRAVVDDATPTSRAQRRALLLRTLFGVVLMFLAALTYVQSYRATSCIRNGILERSEAQGIETRAQIVLLEAQINSNRADDLDAILHYLDAARALEKARADNPLRCS